MSSHVPAVLASKSLSAHRLVAARIFPSKLRHLASIHNATANLDTRHCPRSIQKQAIDPIKSGCVEVKSCLPSAKIHNSWRGSLISQRINQPWSSLNRGAKAPDFWSKSDLTSALWFHNHGARAFHISQTQFSDAHGKHHGTEAQTSPSGAREPQNPPLPESSQSREIQTDPKTSSGAGKHIRDRLPQMPQITKPTREELLAAATGFWSRLKVRFKWFSIRSVRPFNIDEISAFFSWVLLGHMLWIILGTTTFFSLAIFAVNTVFAQETLARWVGNYLTKSSGMKVVFESAIVPKWGDGVITFKNVFVSRRPGQEGGRVSKGSPVSEAAAAAVAAKPYRTGLNSKEEEEEDTNYTQFDLSLETVNVTLSFRKWFNSKGLLRDVEIQGVRGVIDRTSVHYDGEYVDPRSYRHEHNPGDFEIDSFKMQDLLVTVHQPNNFRPFSVALFSCELPQLRRQWLFYDFLSASTMSGTIDESIFSLHPRQDHSHTNNRVGDPILKGSAKPWKKQSRLRIDGLNIDHLNRGVDGPFSWIHEGNVDIVADIMFPVDNNESIAKIMSDFYDRMEATVSSHHKNGILQGPDTVSKGPDDDKRVLVMDLRVNLNDIRAAVPLFTQDLSYVNNALIRPIVAYMNSRRTFIPIQCRVVKRASEFDGSWTVFDSGLMDDLSAEVCKPSCSVSTCANSSLL